MQVANNQSSQAQIKANKDRDKLCKYGATIVLLLCLQFVRFGMDARKFKVNHQTKDPTTVATSGTDNGNRDGYNETNTTSSTRKENLTRHFQTFDEIDVYGSAKKFKLKWLRRQREKCLSPSQKRKYEAPAALVREGLEDLMKKLKPSTNSSARALQQTDRERTALCAIQRNEEFYLTEWINYHIALGFDDIYIFDDNDYKNATTSLSSTIPETETVHIIPVRQLPPDGHKQATVYSSCVEIIRGREARHNYKTTWAGFLDVDEYIVLKQHRSIQEFLLDHCPLPLCASIGLRWQFFGTSNHTYYEDRPVTQRFVWREKTVARPIKSIFRVENFLCATSPHRVHLKNDPTVYPPSPPYPYSVTGTIDIVGIGPKKSSGKDDDDDDYNSIAVIHHYTKSLEEWYVRRCLTVDVLSKKPSRCKGGIYPSSGEVEDLIAADFYQTNVLGRQSPYANQFIEEDRDGWPPWIHHNESDFGIKSILTPQEVHRLTLITFPG